MGPETWLPAVGYEGAYEVSSLGRVRSLPGGQRHGKVLKPGRVGRGYLVVSPCVEGVVSRRYVHHLVAEAFIGPRPDGLDVLHNNGDFLDNRASNLRYGTVSANIRDAVAHGNHREASRTRCDYGHEFTPENTYVQSNGLAADGHRKYRRVCRTCRKRQSAAAYQRAKTRAA